MLHNVISQFQVTLFKIATTTIQKPHVTNSSLTPKVLCRPAHWGNDWQV